MAMVTVSQLLDYLGVGEENTQMVTGMRAAALQSLRIGTGIDWEQRSDDALASEAVEIMVWLSFYGNRSNVGNEEHLRRRLIAIMCQLNYGKEAANAENEQGDAAAPETDG